MKTTAERWKIGDTYYQAHGLRYGQPWDIGSEPRQTEAEAREDGDDWQSWLTAGEREGSEVYVVRYRITAIDDDGSIGSAESY